MGMAWKQEPRHRLPHPHQLPIVRQLALGRQEVPPVRPQRRRLERDHRGPGRPREPRDEPHGAVPGRFIASLQMFTVKLVAE